MKSICPKFKINSGTYFVFLSFLLTGFIKNILLIFLIILTHELGHVFFLKLFHYEIERVEIFPFGGLTTTKNKYINSPINKDIIIYFGGVLFQGILYFFVFLLFHFRYLSEYTFSLFKTYNTSILIFNLLPIYPLDGGEILHLFLEKYLPYQKGLTIKSFLSFLFLTIFVLYNVKSNLNNYIALTFLLYKTIDFTKKKKLFTHKFLLERYMHTFPYKKIEHDEKEDLSLLKKETLHFFKNGDKYLHEQEIVKRKFDIHAHF